MTYDDIFMFILQAITTGEILAQFQIFFAEIHFPLLKKSSDSPGQNIWCK